MWKEKPIPTLEMRINKNPANLTDAAVNTAWYGKEKPLNRSGSTLTR